MEKLTYNSKEAAAKKKLARTAEKLAYNSKEAAAALGISLPTFYELSNKSGFPVVRVGRRVLVPVDALREWLAKEATHGSV